MGRRDDVREGSPDAQADGPGGPSHSDRPGEATNRLEWVRELRSAVRCAGVLLALLLLVDWGAGRITPWRAVLWCALAGLLFVTLYPQRVCARENLLVTRGLLRAHRVRTDLLVSVRCMDGVSQRLLLRDALGGRVEIDPRVLVRHPRLWFYVDRGTRKAAADGRLLCGVTALRSIARRIDREAAHAVFRSSGLE
ncbi:hypothetical protein N4P33_12910 [Streptomyces sp. 15-116A]|uniref:hypothetical protein n=1 Tax=Streptomyces sp. 15-116A TaxID=2259035 RepID=UPI0021B39FD6|nr:hypothetical protein [Streptomyces sp. 15-116A]MCT7353068.1 hypothetical protein [Streptomyces sp. 15-116A]